MLEALRREDGVVYDNAEDSMCDAYGPELRILCRHVSYYHCFEESEC